MNKDQLKALHKSSFKNGPLVRKHKGYCACFYCLRIMKAEDIKEFTKCDDTAVCPFCDIDSVVLATTLTCQDVADMRTAYFETSAGMYKSTRKE